MLGWWLDGIISFLLQYLPLLFVRHNLSSFIRTRSINHSGCCMLCVQMLFVSNTKSNIWFIHFDRIHRREKRDQNWEWVTIQQTYHIQFPSYVSLYNIPEGNVLQYSRYRSSPSTVYSQSEWVLDCFYVFRYFCFFLVLVQESLCEREFCFISSTEKDRSLQFGNIWTFWKALNCRNNTIGNQPEWIERVWEKRIKNTKAKCWLTEIKIRGKKILCIRHKSIEILQWKTYCDWFVYWIQDDRK